MAKSCKDFDFRDLIGEQNEEMVDERTELDFKEDIPPPVPDSSQGVTQGS